MTIIGMAWGGLVSTERKRLQPFELILRTRQVIFLPELELHTSQYVTYLAWPWFRSGIIFLLIPLVP